jgi:hypothetical protein
VERFTLISGTHIGTDHAKPGTVGGKKNNQDALLMFQSGELVIGVVCDGCGSGVHSEFGARLQAGMLVRALRDNVPAMGPLSQDESKARTQIQRALFRTQQHVIGELSSVARSMVGLGDSLTVFVQIHLLATAVGFVITPEWTFVFNCGDGYYGVNGDVNQIGPFDKNAPPYLAYALTGSALLDKGRDALDLKIQALRRTSEVTSIWIATDGVEDLIKAKEAFIPGQKRFVGPLEQIWTDPAFLNPALLQRWLNLANNFVPVTSGFPHPSIGRLSDDTTIVAAIRTAPKEA